jgi:hypothetical protein
MVIIRLNYSIKLKDLFNNQNISLINKVLTRWSDQSITQPMHLDTVPVQFIQCLPEPTLNGEDSIVE